jgi:hypothetical protein
MLANPYRPTTADAAGVWIIVVPGIGVAGILATIAALLGSARALLALFVASFFPFGLYLMFTPGIFRWFGLAAMGYLIAAVLLKRRRDA